MNKNIDILSNPKSAFWKISTPLYFLFLFNSCYSIVNLFWVSQLSQEAFFAFGVAQPLIGLITGFGDAVGLGTNSLISREIGENDLIDSYNSILHGIVTCLIVGAILALLTFFLKDILNLMNITTSVDLVIDYLTPLFTFSFLTLLSSLFINTLQAEGNSKTPTAVIILTNIINLILVPIFTFVLDLGIKGVAYATIVSTLIAVIIFLYVYLSKKTEVVLNFKYFKPGIVYEIFAVSIPDFIINILWSVCMMFINSVLIAQLGQIGVLLYSTASQIEQLISSPQSSFSRSLVTVCGQLFGANEIQKLKEMFHYTLKIAVVFSIICTVVFFFIRDYGFSLFSVTGVETSVFYIALFGILIVPAENAQKISCKMLDGLGKSYHSLILTNSMIIFEIILIKLLAPILTSGVCVLIGICLTEIIFAIVFYILVRSILNGENELEELIEHEKEKHLKL